MNTAQIKNLYTMNKFDIYLNSIIDFDELGSETVSERVYSEYKWAIDRYGKIKACQEYLQGLPSWINCAFYNYDILKNFYQLSDDDIDFLDTDELIEHYWDRLGRSLSKLI